MVFPFALSTSCLIENQAVLLYAVIFGVISLMMFAAYLDTSPSFLLTRHPNWVVSVRIKIPWLRGCKRLGLGHSPFPIIFNLYIGKKVIPIFIGYGTTVLIIILQLILRGFRDFVLSGNANDVFIKIFFIDGPMLLLKLSALHWRWG